MTASAMERGQRGVKRVLDKLENSIETGNFYEAHQMYRTLYFRYTSQRKYDDCLDLLWCGANTLVNKQQEACAVDLALLIIDTLERTPHIDGNEGLLWIQRLGYFLKDISASTVERDTLVNRCIKWSGEMSGNSNGHPAMHKYVAQMYWAEGNMEQARNYYLLCRDGNLCGHIIIKLHLNKGYRSEVDLFIVQAVLQQLSVKDHETAERTFVTYTTFHPQIRRKSSPFRQPLLNFVHFLFLSIQLGRYETFQALCDFYKLSLKRDSSYENYLEKIAMLYFSAPPQPTMLLGGDGILGGVFGDMVTRLFQGLDDDNTDTESDEAHHGSNSVWSELD